MATSTAKDEIRVAQELKRPYVLVLVLLAVITLIEVQVPNLPAWIGVAESIVILLLVVSSVAKAVMVALYYMHLRYEPRVLKFLPVAPLVFVVLLAVVVVLHSGNPCTNFLPDSQMRARREREAGPNGVPQEREGEGGDRARSAHVARIPPEVVDDDEPQGDRDPVHHVLVLLLRPRWHPRDVHSGGARAPRADDPGRGSVRTVLFDSRHDDDLPVHHPCLRRVRELLRAPLDRREGHGVPPDQRPRVLDAAGRRRPHLARSGGRRLDGVRTAVVERDLHARRGRGHVARRPDHRGDVLDPGGDQLPRDNREIPQARDDVPEDAPVRVVHPHGLHHGRDGHSGPRERPDARVPGPKPRHVFLQLRRRMCGQTRPPDPLAAPLLVLLPPGRIHHDPSGDGRDQRGHPEDGPEADLRLLRDGDRDVRNRFRGVRRMGPPYVHHGLVAHRASPVHVGDDGGRGADGREDFQLARDDMEGQRLVQDTDVVRDRVPRALYDWRHYRRVPRVNPPGLQPPRYVLGRGAPALRPLRRVCDGPLCGMLLLVPDDDGPDVQRAPRSNSLLGDVHRNEHDVLHDALPRSVRDAPTDLRLHVRAPGLARLEGSQPVLLDWGVNPCRRSAILLLS